MALKPITAGELERTPTVFASFMGYMDRRYKTFGQLLAIYRECSRSLTPSEDLANDLRVERFMRDMMSNRWKDEVVLRIGVFEGNEVVVDGIHRGMAYLACVEAGVSPDRLPAVCVSR